MASFCFGGVAVAVARTGRTTMQLFRPLQLQQNMLSVKCNQIK
jgi:hypothetical protein